MTVENDDHHDMEGEQQYGTMTFAGWFFGMPSMHVEDIVETDRVTKVPLASKQTAGVMNLRGRVVTVIDLQQCLGSTNGNGSSPALQAPAANENADSEETPEKDLTQKYSIAVEKNQSLYTLLVDNIGDVRASPDSGLEPVPPNSDAQLRQFASGVYRLQDEPLVVLDVDKVFELLIEAA